MEEMIVSSDEDTTIRHTCTLVENYMVDLISWKGPEEFNGTPIQFALFEGNISILQKLLASGGSLNRKWVFAAINKLFIPSYYTGACNQDRLPGLIYFIVENGFDVNAKNHVNCSLLHFAVKLPTEEGKAVVDFLLKRNADINAKNNMGATPLDLAVWSHNDSMVKFLVEHKNGVNLQDGSSYVILLHYAVLRSDYAMIKLLLERKWDVNRKDMGGDTALHHAIMKCADKSVELLINGGADLNITNNIGLSAWSLFKTLHDSIENKKLVFYMERAKKMDLAKKCIKLYDQKLNFGIINSRYFGCFEEKCLQELDLIKAKKFGNNSFFDVLSDCQVPVFVCNNEIANYITSDDFHNKFPLYASFLRRKFKEKKEMNYLLDNMRLCLRTMKGLNEALIVLPSEISRYVYSFLELHDILNVKRAFETN